MKFFTEQKSNKSNTSLGFVLPFAVLISGILLSIGLGIFSITIKELTISSSGRESQFAFYAADTGGECALFWDIRHAGFDGSVFATSSDSVLLPNGSGVNCNNEDITIVANGWDPASGWDVSGQTATAATTIFDMAFSNGSCATVYVFKDSEAAYTTRIDSHGFNTCDQNNTRRVERGLRIRY
ncbi:hypothetical protein ACFL0K_00440 [Patescibacteria group bacterium]